MFFYMYRSESHPRPVAIREVSSSNRLEKVHRPMTRHYEERESLIWKSLSIPLAIRNHTEKDSVGVREDRGHQKNKAHKIN